MPGEKKKSSGGGLKKAGQPGALPEHLETQRKYVICGADKNYHVSRVCRGREVVCVL
jgi:hypothetical protein